MNKLPVFLLGVVFLLTTCAQRETAPEFETSSIVIYKQERELELYVDSELFGTYKIALGAEPIGIKDKEGDNRTPEGEYYVCTRHNKTSWKYFLGISYPNTTDAQRNLDDQKIEQEVFDKVKSAIDKKEQPPWDTPLGGAIGMHGGGTSSDWTEGCIAVSDHDISIIKDYAPLKTPVTIYESRRIAESP